ncbi:MAG TPA: sulfite exporter TauE/SafE family protein [Candidatus Binataceae bacterium]|nr:sulfite exporter TauE/SafE family protein [Candidatus Binataceae bacterium]
MNLSFTLLGFIVATLVGMTGVGGGSVMVPVLILGMHVAPGVAVGTDLLYTAVTRAGALWVYARQGQVRWPLAGRMLAGSLPAAGVALAALWLLGRGQRDFDAAANVALSVALTASAAAILFREQLGSLLARNRTESPDGPLRRFLPVAAGIVIGALVSLSSVGAGALGVTFLLLLFPTIKTRHLVGTDLAHGVVLALATGLGHMLIAPVDFVLLGQLLLGTLPGIYVGTRMAGLLPETALRRAIAVVLLGVAVKLVV